jgi:hypothetical protein
MRRDARKDASDLPDEAVKELRGIFANREYDSFYDESRV